MSERPLDPAIRAASTRHHQACQRLHRILAVCSPSVAWPHLIEHGDEQYRDRAGCPAWLGRRLCDQAPVGVVTCGMVARARHTPLSSRRPTLAGGLAVCDDCLRIYEERRRDEERACYALLELADERLEPVRRRADDRRAYALAVEREHPTGRDMADVLADLAHEDTRAYWAGEAA